MSFLAKSKENLIDVDCSCLTQYDSFYIKDKYQEVLRAKDKYALFLINIKNFRYYNTKYGNTEGDEILAIVFHKLKGILEDGEFIAHLYADNFAFLLQYNDVHSLIYERFMQLVDDIYRIEDERIFRNIFYSFGVYLLDDKDINFMDALNYANLCRKECDSLTNRSSCLEIYDDSFYKRYMDHLELEIKTADAYKNYEFVTYLQPKVDLANEKVIGAEALLRWFDKDGKMIPLYEFLPILNENSYIQLVDLDIFEEMCKYLQKRLDNKQTVVPISFNISKSYFYNPDIIKEYIGVFEKYNIPKNLIEIEFMESISLDNTDRMQTIISGFKEYGFTCLLDDFGNGYSSFNVLLNAPLDIVKMDRQFFLKNLNGDNELVIKTVIDLIHSLHMKVVAEGVEEKAHIDFLKICKCDFVQGFYYYKPMSVDNFSALLDSSNT